MLKDILLLLLNKKWAVRLGLDEYNRNHFPEIFEIMVEKGIEHGRIFSEGSEYFLESLDEKKPSVVARFRGYGNYAMTVFHLKVLFGMEVPNHSSQAGIGAYEHCGILYQLRGITDEGSIDKKEPFHIFVDSAELAP